MGYQFWHKWDSKAVATLATKWTNYKLNKPDEFKRVVAEERKRLKGYALAQRRFEKFLNSLPNTVEEVERQEQRRANLEALRRALSLQRTRRVKVSEKTIDDRGEVLKRRDYTTTQYVDKAMQAFFEWAQRQEGFNTNEFDPIESYKDFFNGYLKRLKPTRNKAKRQKVGRPSGFDITEEEQQITKDRLSNELSERRAQKDSQGKAEYRSYVSKGFWPRLAAELRPECEDVDGFIQALRDAVKPKNKSKKSKKK